MYSLPDHEGVDKWRNDSIGMSFLIRDPEALVLTLLIRRYTRRGKGHRLHHLDSAIGLTGLRLSPTLPVRSFPHGREGHLRTMSLPSAPASSLKAHLYVQMAVTAVKSDLGASCCGSRAWGDI